MQRKKEEKKKGMNGTASINNPVKYFLSGSASIFVANCDRSVAWTFPYWECVS